ncbi:MAG: T9SS type A sorting domain-containing protein, partial [Bacteroidota bacterium]|nr:T9SS type A sorting domain-containing protein [Bacteroidota bacterium]
MYDFTDGDLPASRVLRYRLKQVDMDGAIEYSREIPVTIHDASPRDFVLEQNYPNPFNPATTIRYTLPRTGDVELYVTDAIGTRIATLVDRNQHAGAHHVFFDAARLSSGAYFYHLRYEGGLVTRKMTVLK